MKKIFFSLFTSIFFITLCFGNDSFNNYGHEMCEDEMMGIYNSNAKIKLNKCHSYYIFGEFLYLEPRENGLDYAIYTNGSNRSSLSSLDFDFKPAFKLGLGYISNFDGWEIELNYFRLNTKMANADNYSANDTAYPLWYILSEKEDNPQISNGQGEWKLDLNLFNLLLSRAYYTGKNITFDPYVGLISGWVDQKYFSKYVLTSDSTTINGEFESDSWLVGPKAGIEIDYLINWGFKVTGNLSLSLFYQHFKNSFKQTKSTGDIIGNDDKSLIVPDIEMLLGLKWEKYLSKDRFFISTYIGYQFLVMWNQNQLTNYKDLINNKIDGNSENLMIQGFNIGLMFAF